MSILYGGHKSNFEKDLLYLLVGISSIFFISWISTLQVDLFLLPKPFYIFGLSWIVGGWVVFILPVLFFVIYLIQIFFSPKAPFYMGCVVIILNAMYILYFFSKGLSVQGLMYVVWVCILNSMYVLFFIIIVSSDFLKNNSIKKYKIINLYVFIGLSWCCFPMLGEMP